MPTRGSMRAVVPVGDIAPPRAIFAEARYGNVTGVEARCPGYARLRRGRDWGRLAAMDDQGRRPDDRVVVPDDVLAPGQGPMPTTPWSRRPAAPTRRGQVPLRFVFLGLVVAGSLLVLGTTSIRGWWAHRLHDVTGGSWSADFVIGLVIGALPLVG